MFRKLFTIVILSLFFICGCTSSNMPKIYAFRNQIKIFKINHIREKIIKDTARSVGARAALAWSSANINKLLKVQSEYLDRIYNFNILMLDNNVVPPVIVEGDDSLKIDNPSTLRIADKLYRIVKPAYFTTVPLSWRSYLLMNYSEPKAPNRALLPKTNQERDLWNRYVIIGWKEGLVQADDIFAVNVNRLNRDINGMILYRKLLAQGLVTKPFVSKADLGVTGNNNNLRINDRILRITAAAKLIKSIKHWKPHVYSKSYLYEIESFARGIKRKVSKYIHSSKSKKHYKYHEVYYGKKDPVSVPK